MEELNITNNKIEKANKIRNVIMWIIVIIALIIMGYMALLKFGIYITSILILIGIIGNIIIVVSVYYFDTYKKKST